MSASSLFVWLRVLHVLSGTLWVGGTVVVAVFVVPAIQSAGQAGSLVMHQLTTSRKLPAFLMAAGVVTLVSGAYLYWFLSRSAFLPWLGSGPGLTYTVGAVAAIATAVLGSAVNVPAARRLGDLAASQKDGAEIDSAQAEVRKALATRLSRGTRAATALLVLAALTMGAARYIH